jgi:hypothetical protein
VIISRMTEKGTTLYHTFILSYRFFSLGIDLKSN